MKLETIKALADRCGVAYEVAHNWAMRGDIPTIKLGKRRMVITENEQLPPPPTYTGLRLLCLLVKGRDGKAHYWPVQTLRPMPPRVCFASAYYTSAFYRWRLEGSTGRVVNNPGLYLRETHAKRPTAQVLERCGKHRQASAIRAAARTFRADGVSA